MIRLRHKMLISGLRVADQLFLIITAIAVFYFRPDVKVAQQFAGSHDPQLDMANLVGFALLGIGWIAIFDYCLRYRGDRFVAMRIQIHDGLKATTLSTFWFLAISALFSFETLSTLNLFIFWWAVSLLVITSRILLRMTLMVGRRSGYNYRYLLIVGTNPRAQGTVARIEASPELGYKIVGFVTEESDDGIPNPETGGYPIIGTLPNLRNILESKQVDEIMVCLPVEARVSDITRIVRDAKELGLVVRILPDFGEGFPMDKLHLEEFGNEFVITLFREQMLLQLLLKRIADILISIVVIIATLPITVAVAIVIKLTSKGPIFFGQQRFGMNKRPFTLYKFRSMVADAEELKAALAQQNEMDGPAFKIKDDPRITRIGKFIRKMSIDELPQLINVLRGEMSLVGPRPPLPDEVEKYDWLFRKRLSIKPGLTCIWQVSGRNNVSFEEWMEMDRQYVENWSLGLDAKILLKTIPTVLLAKGAS